MSLSSLIEHWLQIQWYGRTEPNPLLLPLEAVFRRAAEWRRRRYQAGRLPIERLSVPVVVVGNLSVGGTGKTPLCLWLAEFLGRHGYRPGLISRGYGARTALEPLAVGREADPRVVGDEPLLLARRSGRPVMVGRDRAAAGRALLAASDCDLLIADDGLQHLALHRDLEIAVVDGVRGFGNGHCLPAGPLREPPERLRSVDLVVYSGMAPAGACAMRLEGEIAVNLRDPALRRPLAGFAGVPLFAVAGIGHPERFFDQLRSHGLAATARAFPDHHDYQPDDLAFAGAAPLLMTEKDAVKCMAFAGPNHWYLPVAARLPETFGPRLLTLLKEKTHGQDSR